MSNAICNPIKIETVDGFEIWFTPLVEDTDPSDIFSETEDQGLVEDLRQGWISWFVAKVEARKAGVTLATDYLGGCTYDNIEDFYTTDKNDAYSDMVMTVISDAKDKIKELTE